MSVGKPEQAAPALLRRLGKRNLFALYSYTAASRLWFDGSLWLIYWQHQGLSLAEVGILEAILHVTAVVFDVPVGILADRLGWRLSLLISGLLGALYCFLSLDGTTFAIGALAFAARGLQITFTNGSDMALAYESARWAGLTARYQSIAGRIFAIGLVSLALAEAVGGGLAGRSWTLVYGLFGLSNLLSTLIALFIVDKKHASQTPHVDAGLPDGVDATRGDDETESESERVTVVSIAKDAYGFARSSPLFLRFIVFSAVLSGFVATFAFYGQSILLHDGWSLMGIGIVTGLENAVGAMVSVWSARVTERVGTPRTLSLAGFAASFGMLLFAFVPGVAAAAGYLIGSVSTNLSDPLVDQELNHVIPTGQRATLLSANSTAFSLFMIVVFPLVGFIAKGIGLIHAAWLVSVIAALAVILAGRWLGRAIICHSVVDRTLES